MLLECDSPALIRFSQITAKTWKNHAGPAHTETYAGAAEQEHTYPQED